jgi:hypothetical protein
MQIIHQEPRPIVMIDVDQIVRAMIIIYTVGDISKSTPAERPILLTPSVHCLIVTQPVSLQHSPLQSLPCIRAVRTMIFA